MKPKIRVLLADSHPLVLFGLSKELGKEADIAIVGEAQDEACAVARAKELKPDIILLDVSMPGGQGLKALVRIKKNVPGTRIIVMTISRDDEALLFEGIRLGAEAYLPYEYDGPQLAGLIRRTAT